MGLEPDPGVLGQGPLLRARGLPAFSSHLGSLLRKDWPSLAWILKEIIFLLLSLLLCCYQHSCMFTTFL